MLEIGDLVAGYGDIEVLHGISLKVEAGAIVVVLGANGAGKTTLLRTISGLVRPRSGSVVLEGRRIDRMAPEAIVARGMSHVPQGRRIFPGLTVLENLIVAQTAATKRAQQPFAAQLEAVFDLFPALKERRQQLGWSLSGGEQQMLAVGRALIARPKLILLDEPSLGLAPLIVESMFAAIAALRAKEGLAFLVVEQNARQAMRIADFCYVLEMGRFVASGDSATLRGRPEIEQAYLGV